MKKILRKGDSDIHKIIFDPVVEALDRKSTIVLWKTLKANGENCSISWVEDL